MKPYYELGAIAIYHCDCAEFMATRSALPIFDVVLTDPPYGISSWSSTGGNSLSADESAEIAAWDTRPSDEVMRLVLASATRAIVWGGNHFSHVLGSCRSPLIWDKANRGMHYADGEFAWTNFDYGALRIFNLSHQASGYHGKRLHPTEKPVELMRWCLSHVRPEPKTVFDPFMGSGSTLVAAKNMGLSVVGCELSEKYCEVAASRLSQGVLSELFT